MTTTPRKPYRLILVLLTWCAVTTYYAAHEINDRLRLHYTSGGAVSGMTVTDVSRAIQGTPAGRKLP